MPSASDFLKELKGANNRLDGVNGRLDGVNTRLDGVNSRLDGLIASVDAVRNAVDQVNATLKAGFSDLIKLGLYTNLALYHNDQQNDTMICILEHISKNTCELLNQATIQTGLQKVIQANTTELAQLYEATHAEAALIREREEALRSQIERCCPPPPVKPVCSYEPCKKPDPIPEPPQIDQGGGIG